MAAFKGSVVRIDSRNAAGREVPADVARGPFVMKSETEIMQPYADYRAGRFGPSVSAAPGQT